MLSDQPFATNLSLRRECQPKPMDRTGGSVGIFFTLRYPRSEGVGVVRVPTGRATLVSGWGRASAHFPTIFVLCVLGPLYIDRHLSLCPHPVATPHIREPIPTLFVTRLQRCPCSRRLAAWYNRFVSGPLGRGRWKSDPFYLIFV